MRGLIAALLLCVSFAAMAEEPRYGDTYSREDVVSIIEGCLKGAFKIEKNPTKEQIIFCGCVAWWIAQSVPSYEFVPMSREATGRLLRYAGGQCKGLYPAPKKDEPKTPPEKEGTGI